MTSADMNPTLVSGADTLIDSVMANSHVHVCELGEGLWCVYEPHLKQRKEVLQAELARERENLRAINTVLNLLRTH